MGAGLGRAARLLQLQRLGFLRPPVAGLLRKPVAVGSVADDLDHQFQFFGLEAAFGGGHDANHAVGNAKITLVCERLALEPEDWLVQARSGSGQGGISLLRPDNRETVTASDARRQRAERARMGCLVALGDPFR